MNPLLKTLEEFLNNSSPEQLREELQKGNRPFFQTLTDPILVCESEYTMPNSIPAYVSFFKGKFSEKEVCSRELSPVPSLGVEAANQELALAA